MHELAHSLILNEEALNSLPEKKRPLFIYEWLCFLNKILIAAQKSDILECQSRVVGQLLQQTQYGFGRPIRVLIGRNLATLICVGGPFSLSITINRCNNMLKSKDEVTKLTTIVIIGELYERLVGQAYEETVELLLRTLKDADSPMCFEILFTLKRIINGLGSAGGNIHGEIFRIIKSYMNDRAMSVRSAAATCLIALIKQNNFMYTNELEGNVILGFRAFDGSNYEVRRSVAKYLAVLLAASQGVSSNTNQNFMTKSNVSLTSIKNTKAEDILNYLAEGFLKSNTTEHSKGSTTVQREIRIGVTHTYVELIRVLGTTWIEENLSLFINHILELAGNPRASTTPVDAVYSRKCITFILRSVLDSHLSEKARLTAAQELVTIITRYTTPQSVINSSPILTNDSTVSSLNSSTNSMIQSFGSSSIEYHQHILICALHELSLLIQRFGTLSTLLLKDSCNGLIDTLFLVILHPSHSVRLSAAWCFRSIGIALPSLVTSLIDKSFEKMNDLAKQSASCDNDAMFGYGLALQALLGTVHQSSLGIPSQRAKTIFDFAYNLLRTTTASIIGQQQSLIPCILLQRTHTAWHLLSACCTLGQQFLKKIISRLVLLWRSVFPRSQSDFQQEKQRGDSFTWILSFNQRSDALCSMISFLNNCSIGEEKLLTDDLLKSMLIPVENAIIILLHVPVLINQFGHQLKASIIIFRLRLYELLLLIPIQFYEQYFKVLLRELITEFTLIDNPSNTTTSLLKSILHDNDSVLLSSSFQETDYQVIEEQLQSNFSSGSGALEHDETYLYRRHSSLSSLNIINYLFHSSSQIDNNSSDAYYSRLTELNSSEPLSSGIAVIDASVKLYSTIFIRVSNKQRLNMLQHFIGIIKQSKGARQEAIQINILTAVLLSLKTLAETKPSSSIDDDNLKKCACTLIIQTMNHSNPILRYAASEALGRLIHVINDGRFVTEIVQFCINHLKDCNDIQSQTGYSLALGCLHRYVSSINTGQYLNLSASILLELAQDQSATIVQVWAIHALTLIANSSGQMFRSYVEPSLTLILHLLLSTSSSQIDIFQCCGRLLSALIITIGPEFQINTSFISIVRSSCLTASHILQMHIESVVQAEAIQSIQHLHLFAPRHVNLSMLVPELIKGLKSRDLSLRRACVSCLRQLSQREAKEVSEHATLSVHDTEQELSSFRSLEELLFSMLDTETDTKLCSNVQDTLVYMLQTLGPHNLTHWLQLYEDILATTAEKSNMITPLSETDHQTTMFFKSVTCSNTNDDSDGDERSQTTTEQNLICKSTSMTKWQTKVFVVDCVQKLITYCEQITPSNHHFDYISAKERLRTYPNEDYLVIHLNTLITFSFMASTSTNDQLHSAGLSLLKQIILKFADQLILEQHQTQISAALRPAFSQGTSSYVTAQACDVCSTWISSSVKHDLNDFRRIHQLLVLSLQKLVSIQQRTNMIYSETALTIENLAILNIWADVYNIVTIRQKENQSCNLLIVLQTEFNVIIHLWLAVLTDYACLTLPNDFGGISRNPLGGNFYSIESNIDLTRRIYKANWASIMQATTQWLAEHHYELEMFPVNEKLVSNSQQDILMTKLLTLTFPKTKEAIFAMLLGCCVEALSVSEQADETIEIILSSLINLLQSDLAVRQLTPVICIELINVLHRLCFIRTDIKTHFGILKILEKIFHLLPSSTHISSVAADDHFISGESFIFASLKLLTSLLVNYYPNIAGDLQIELTSKPNQDSTNNLQMVTLISSTIKLLCELVTLCTTIENTQTLVPVILHLLLSISFILLSKKCDQQKSLLSTILQMIDNIFSKYINENISHCAMITIINLRINLIEKDISDNGYFVRCLTSLIINSNSIELTKQIINFYRKAFDDQESETRLHVFQCINELFQSKNLPLRNRLIRIFTPLLLIKLKQTNNQQQIIEILKIFETLLSVVDSTLRIRLASSIIPLFINFLFDLTSSNLKNDMHLISYIIERIQYLFPLYPNEFRLILQTSPDLQTKLENSIYRQQQKQNIKELNYLTKNSIVSLDTMS